MKSWSVVSALMPLLAVLAHGQQLAPPTVEWQRVYGNTESDSFGALQQTSDGGYIVGGTSYSPANGNKTCQGFGNVDYWVVRLDADGNLLWDRCFGGHGQDTLSSLQETVDRGWMVAGYSSSSNSGNKTTTHFGGTGSSDFWIIRLDASGGKIWEQNYGLVSDELFTRVMKCTDGGWFISGSSGGPSSGNLSADGFGYRDYWTIKLDADGRKLWDKAYGGSGTDMAWCAASCADGGIILGGASDSQPSGNKTSPNFGSTNRYEESPDFWVVRLDSAGNKLWDRSYGGIYDDTLYALAEMPDGGFILAGRSLSPPGGNKTAPSYGNADFWIVRIDADGNKLWDQSFGGPEDDFPAALAVTTDGGVIIGGRSFSGISGTKTSTNYGACDFWVIRLDADGRKLWEQTYGGSRTDGIEGLQQTSDGGFILGGFSFSPADGNKTEPPFFGVWSDIWVVKLGPEQPHLSFAERPFEADGVRLSLLGIKHLSFAIEWSRDLTNWTGLQTYRLTNATLEVLDSSASNAVQRFYRARQVP